jgi:rare lipoprotein A
MIELFLVASLQCRTVSASYYSDWYQGRQMANGQRFSQSSDSAASNDYPIGTRLRVTYNGRSTTVVIRDRMANSGRIDLTTSSFQQLTNLSVGRMNVRVCR